MDDSASPNNNPWSQLSTVTTFDRGNDSWTTRRMDEVADSPARGRVVGRVSPSTSLLIESLVRQLCALFEGDVVRRNELYYAICDKLHQMKLIDASYNMGELELVRSQYQRALYHLFSVARASTGSESALQVPSSLAAEWSRYRREFREISFIAKGGFGDVFKVRHHLDGTDYAIKRIIVRTGRVKTMTRYLVEVKTLAALHHPNIVPYKGAWIEPTLPSSFCPPFSAPCQESNGVRISEKLSNDSSNVDSRKNEEVDHAPKINGWDTFGSESSEVKRLSADKLPSDRIQERSERSRDSRVPNTNVDDEFESKISDKSYSSLISFRSDFESGNRHHHREQINENSSTESKSTRDSNDTESGEESARDKQLCHYNNSMKNPALFATLYIQMALCQRTLRQWLDERIEPTPEPLITVILTQILGGLDYIHSRGIVHHDIKPSNIFISTTDHLQLQLGDFGLACPLQRDTHHSVFGTRMYAAPEQLRGKCNPKSDMYSLGIVLLELLIPMKTSMERSRMVGALKAGQIPTNLTVHHPKWAFVTSQLVQADPSARPTTKQLLQELNEDKDVTITKLERDNEQQTTTIRQLTTKLEEQEKEIARLKKLLENT